MTLTQLNAFVLVARLGSVTSAANVPVELGPNKVLAVNTVHWSIPARQTNVHPVDGGTRLVQSEAFRGLLVPFSIKTLAAAQSSYQALNNALKAYVEAQR